jgi:hypothetical protein
VLNVGTGPTTGAITVVDTLHAGLTFSALSGAGWTGGAVGNVVTATYAAPLAAADSAVFTLTVLVGPAAFPSVQNSAVAQTPDDNNPGNDRGSDAPRRSARRRSSRSRRAPHRRSSSRRTS